MAKSNVPADIAAMGFEEAMKELETIVKQLEGGQVKLDQAVQAYERGNSLKAHCQTKLDEARIKIEKITGVGKTLGLEPVSD
jgi:exodeoxyribonuclease VII small subunit